ncbi:MAG: diguanylate cyclase [Pseudomonadota bacterium]
MSATVPVTASKVAHLVDQGDDRVRKRLFDQTYRFLKVAELPELAGAVALAFGFAYLLDEVAGPSIWLAALTVAILVRGICIRLESPLADGVNLRKVYLTAASNGACGLIWGLAILTLVPEGNEPVEWYALLWLISVSVSGVATMSLSSWIPLMHALTIVACVVVRLSLDGSYLGSLIVIGLLALYGFLLTIAVFARRSLVSEIQLRLANVELVGEIDAERQRMDALNAELTQEIKRRELLEEQLRADRKRAEERSTTDGLTGIANRRAFDEAIAREVRRAARSAEPLSLILLDADYFKAYNDEYGHQAGDTALQLIAKELRNATRRASDLVARYGGEEFAILLPTTNLTDARILAERARGGIEARRLEHAGSKVANVLTVCAGVASVDGSQPDAAKQLLHQADTALYEAKRRGRNRVTTSAEVEPRAPAT